MNLSRALHRQFIAGSLESPVSNANIFFAWSWKQSSIELNPELEPKREKCGVQICPGITMQFSSISKIIRASSEASLTAFAQISPEELQKMQDNFVKACGGNTTSHSIPPLQGEGQGEGFSAKAKKKKGLRFGKIREKHPNAFRSWTQGQDKELEE